MDSELNMNIFKHQNTMGFDEYIVELNIIIDNISYVNEISGLYDTNCESIHSCFSKFGLKTKQLIHALGYCTNNKLYDVVKDNTSNDIMIQFKCINIY